ncbi:polar flagellar assembly protein FliO [Alteromonas macleodii str. 'Balearic Sea AD45']|uniref:flagellar biosynthetic protein FliO n=1 Tax=Alteromonas macleodii TaxID=28108 RepID=UPI000286D8A6|nr:flagellar biosynthetic protein FliO [Alteromonas macleodii]AFT94502.1 polar flagellar assembly protein FliO [Alteromonas macleodii str. 'Balearic Sea AD45']
MLPLLFSQIAVAQSTQSITNPTSVLSIFLSLLVVVGVIFALAYVMRRFNVTAMGGNQMKVAASMVVGTKEKIMVIQVGEEQHLIGVTSHNISHLSKLDKNLDVPVKGVNKTTGEQQNGSDAFKQKLVAAMAEKLNPNIEKNKTKEESRDA